MSAPFHTQRLHNFPPSNLTAAPYTYPPVVSNALQGNQPIRGAFDVSCLSQPPPPVPQIRPPMTNYPVGSPQVSGQFYNVIPQPSHSLVPQQSVHSTFQSNLIPTSMPSAVQYSVPPPSTPFQSLALAPHPPAMPQHLNAINFVSVEPTQSLVDPKETALQRLLDKFKWKAKSVSCEKESVVTVAEYSSLANQAFAILRELEQEEKELENLVLDDGKVWNHRVKYIVKQQNSLSSILNKLSDPDNIKTILFKLNKIKKKRMYMKRRKTAEAKLKTLKEEKRAALHAEIDRFHEVLREKDQQQKREAEMKKEADGILSEVRKKIHEAKHMLKKLKVLEKCRHSKKENALKKGRLILPTHDRNFENKLSEMRTVVLKQLSDYEAEERALKVMLETEHEGQIEMEVQWKLKKLKLQQEKKHSKIMACLFGDTEQPKPDDPMYLFHLHYSAANTSLENLIDIRHSWDVHLVPLHNPQGSSIPPQWVVPSEPTDETWASVLQE